MTKSLKVRKKARQKSTSTDINLLVAPDSKEEFVEWDRQKIADQLILEADLNERIARSIAKEVERRVLASNIAQISTSLIRELVDNELFERGYQKKLHRQNTIGMPKHDIEELVFSKSQENSNIISNNPEAVGFTIAETVMKQYALQEVFSADVADAHYNGAVHLHDLGQVYRVYCSSHSLEYIKMYGLDGLDNLDSISKPAKHARTLTVHLNTFLANMQMFYAGALGVAYLNIMYAPYLEGMTDAEIRQEAQHLMFQTSQNAFSRGGQALFLDFNIHTGIPGYLKNIKAVGPGGKYTGRTYASYEDTAMRFTRALLEISGGGDGYNRPFSFPKLDVHINAETFEDPKQAEILEYACKIASKNGSVYFIFDRDEVTLSACCRLRTQIDDNYMIEHPESMRYCGFQNVTINLPQCAYRAGKGNYEAFQKELEKTFNICIKAHLQKKEFIHSLMHSPSRPLWQIGRMAKDGRPYVDLEAATYIIGVLGLNECLQYLFDVELHESEEALWQGLRIVSYLHFLVKGSSKRHGLKFTIEESPAESASGRLARIDARNYKEAIIRGSGNALYYTNSIHLRPDADVSLAKRISYQARYHSLIESGAIIHAFVGEHLPSAKSIMNIVEKTFRNTAAAQLTISPEFTLCSKCGRTAVGLRDKCDRCGAYNIDGMSMGELENAFADLQSWDEKIIKKLNK